MKINKRNINQPKISSFNPNSHNNKIDGKGIDINFSQIPLKDSLEKINSKLDNLLKEKQEIDKIKIKLERIQNLLINFEEVIKHIESIEENIKKISEDIIKINGKINKANNDEIMNKKNNFINNKKIYIDGNKIKEKKISDFLNFEKKNETKVNYYEPYEIENERVKIIESIKYYVGEYYLPEKEDCLNETVGKFLYSIGGISRKTFSLANKAYSELFNEYKKYLEEKKEWLQFDIEKDKRNFSIWVKKYLNEKQFFEYLSEINSKEIESYLYKDDEKTNNILKELFRDLIRNQTKCLLSIPQIIAQFTNNNCKFENSIMFDIIFKGKKKLVNFCYLPGLKSNGRLITGGEYYVFTFIEGKSFQIKENIFDNEIAVQNPILYSIPDNLYSLQIKPEKKTIQQNNKTFYEITFRTEPLICSEIRPSYILKIVDNGRIKEDKNKTGTFLIEKKNRSLRYYLIISDCLKRNGTFNMSSFINS